MLHKSLHSTTAAAAAISSFQLTDTAQFATVMPRPK